MIKRSWKIDLDLLTPKQLAKYTDSLEVLRLMRTDTSFSKATKRVGVTSSITKKFLGNTIKKSKNRFVARKNDSLLRKVRIYENEKENYIQIKGLKKSQLVARYLGTVGRSIEKNDVVLLKIFENKMIRDSKGKYHKLETNIKNLIQIFDKREEPEFFTIYQRK